MELSEQTMQVLKNYASINGNIVISEGNQVKTISEAKNVLSSASLDVEFPQTFGIYDLNEFLSVLSLVDTPTQVRHTLCDCVRYCGSITCKIFLF